MLFNQDTEDKIAQLFKALFKRAPKLDNCDATISSRLADAAATTQFNSVITAVKSRAATRKVVVLNLPGNGNFIVPEDVYLLWLYECGGGGGGLILGSNGNGTKLGCSGGSAASVVRLPIPVTPGQVIPYIIGEGGIGKADALSTSYIQAGNGGDTSFSNIVAQGGMGGYGMWNGGSPMVSPQSARGGSFIMPPELWGGSTYRLDPIYLEKCETGNFVAGLPGVQNGSTCNPSALAGFNFSGVGGIAFGTGGTTGRPYFSNGGPGIIVLEMETAS